MEPLSYHIQHRATGYGGCCAVGRPCCHICGRYPIPVIDTACPEGGKVGVQLIRTNAKMKGRVENGKPAVTVTIKGEGNIGESQCALDLTREDLLKKVEKKVNESIKQTADAAVRSTQEDYNSDIFGFGESLHRANPKAWKELKKDWDKQFRELSVDVQVDIKLRRIGMIKKTVEERLKENKQ